MSLDRSRQLESTEAIHLMRVPFDASAIVHANKYGKLGLNTVISFKLASSYFVESLGLRERQIQ